MANHKHELTTKIQALSDSIAELSKETGFLKLHYALFENLADLQITDMAQVESNLGRPLTPEEDALVRLHVADLTLVERAHWERFANRPMTLESLSYIGDGKSLPSPFLVLLAWVKQYRPELHASFEKDRVALFSFVRRWQGVEPNED
jgi:hypothetical protein